jgi:hypothetical protein
MKTQIITLLTAIVLTDVTNINQIEIRGNVELYISNGSSDEVKVYNKYYSESALVQGKDGILRITSYNQEKLVVWVSAKDLRSVSAYDNSEVKSFGDFSGIDFSIDLHNNATAKLNLDTFNANITVADRATANLSGRVDKYNLKYTQVANVTYGEFQTGHSSVVRTGVVEAMVTNEL